MCRVKPLGAQVRSIILGIYPTLGLYSIVKHEASVIINLKHALKKQG